MYASGDMATCLSLPALKSSCPQAAVGSHQCNGASEAVVSIFTCWNKLHRGELHEEVDKAPNDTRKAVRDIHHHVEFRRNQRRPAVREAAEWKDGALHGTGGVPPASGSADTTLLNIAA